MKRRTQRVMAATNLSPEEQEAYRNWFEREVMPALRDRERRLDIVDADWQD